MSLRRNRLLGGKEDEKNHEKGQEKNSVDEDGRWRLTL